MPRSRSHILIGMTTLAVSLAACGGDDNSLTLYSGRGEDLVQPVVDLCSEQLGVEIKTRYGDSAEMLLLLQEEGGNTPADVYFSQGAGFLGVLSADNALLPLDESVTSTVSDPNLVSPKNDWVGISGRARTVAYNTNVLNEGDLPDSFVEFTDPKWSGRIGWAPTNASFQDHITALRGLLGEDATRTWLTEIVANDPVSYDGNTAILEGVASGEIDVGFVNHYYLYRLLAEDPNYPVANHFFSEGDPGALVNVAGAGVVTHSQHPEAAEQLLTCLLSAEVQNYFASTNYELPVTDDATPWADLPRLNSLILPNFDLNLLSDLQGTVDLLVEVGAL
jgi:iron(III) transport system substrate-binding protein